MVSFAFRSPSREAPSCSVDTPGGTLFSARTAQGTHTIRGKITP